MSNALVPEKLTNIECCSLATTIFQVVQRCHRKWNETKAKRQQRNIDFFFLKQLPKLVMSLRLQATFSAV